MIRVPPGAAFAVACIGIANFSCMDAIIKRLAIGIGAYDAMLWRTAVGVLLSAALLAIRREPWPSRASLIVNVQRSLAAGLSVLLFFWGLVRVPMGEGLALTFLAPVIAILLAAPMLGEKIRREALIACALAFAGVVVIVVARGGKGGDQALVGQLAIILGSLFYAYNLVLLRRSAQASGPIMITFITNVVMFGLYALAAPFAASLPPGHDWPWIALAAVLATISTLLLAWAYAHAETQKLVTVEYTAFIWATILGALVFGERLGPMVYVGAAMIIAGAMIGSRTGRAAGPISEAAL
jgi:drug/metabolite transporter (DMT)-like permease